jgi:hypothetical protein
MPDEDMGKGHAGVDPNGKAITSKTFQAAADAFGMSVEDAMKNADELIHKMMENKKK